MKIVEAVRIYFKGKKVKGFIIAKVDGHYKIGTYKGIVYKKINTVEKW